MSQRNNHRDSASLEHQPNATGPLADFARSGMYPPPSRTQPATTATAPADANGGTNVYPEFRHLLSTQPTSSSTTTTISPSPNTTHPIPHRPATNPTRQFQSVTPPTDAHALYPELRQRRPNALDQATAAVNAMLSEQLAATGADSTSERRYSQLPPLPADARPAALAPARAPAPAPAPRPLHRTNNFHVGMALVPDLGPLPTLMPFPELDVIAEDKKRGSTDSDSELAELMAALSVDDEEGSESAQEESDTHGKQPSPATPSPYHSALEEEEEEDEQLPPHAPMYKHALQLIRHQLNLPSLAHFTDAKMHAFMLDARRNDRARNQRVREIVAARVELTARMQRRALRWSVDGDVLDFMQEALAKLFYYDEQNWPSLEPLVYEEDEAMDWVVPARRCGMGLAGDWNPKFSFAEPFAPRQRRDGVQEEEPVSPGAERVRVAVARIEDGFGW